MFHGMPLKLAATDTTAGWNEGGQRLVISGTVYQPDQKTPAANVILYFYHTDKSGQYSPRDYVPNSAKKHGHIRGWVMTGDDGRYSIYTSRPVAYPNQKIEAHIHVMLKEPDIDSPYWLDEWVFDDDPLLTKDIRSKAQNLGGSGILKTTTKGGIQYANHDIILGLNIPGYPK
jgi:protocatechuate 3,4-dioxygenase beta subunit